MNNIEGFIFIFVIILCTASKYNAKVEKDLRHKEYARKRFKTIKSMSNRSIELRVQDTSLDETTPYKYYEKLIQNSTDFIGKETVEIPTRHIDDAKERKKEGLPPAISKSVLQEEHYGKKCWTEINAKEYFETIGGLEDRFESVRQKYQEAVQNDDFDKQMLTMMLKTRGAAERAIHSAIGDPGFIPAGINLGGYSMMRLEDSILFFHRMKLRNNTHFRVDHLHNDFENMALVAKLSLNDLHILGAFERATIEKDPSELFYTPTYGEIEFLLRNVQYNMEGRYRLLRNKLTIELVVSDIITSDILMSYQNNETSTSPITLQRKNIDEFLDRLKTDLDKWLKDFFNDYLMYFGLEGNKGNTDLFQYEKEKTIALNDYTDKVLEMIKKKIRELRFDSVQIPNFAITAVNGMQLKVMNGVLRGLDTIHRRSHSTSKFEKDFSEIDMIVGFGSLKATYQYEAVFHNGMPPINGILIVTADELIAHMGLTMSKKPEALDILFDSVQQIKPESLTLEGPANRVIGNFKNLLERHVFTFISNIIIHNVRMLRTITNCEPRLNAFKTKGEHNFPENENVTNISSKNELKEKLKRGEDCDESIDDTHPDTFFETSEESNLSNANPKHRHKNRNSKPKKSFIIMNRVPR